MFMIFYLMNFFADGFLFFLRVWTCNYMIKAFEKLANIDHVCVQYIRTSHKCWKTRFFMHNDTDHKPTL